MSNQDTAPHKTASHLGAVPYWLQPGTASTPVRFPTQGISQPAQRLEQVLLLCFYDPAGVSTVPETVAFLQSASRFAVTVLNLFEHRAQADGYLQLHEWVDVEAFGAIVIHNTVSYNVENLRYLDARLSCKLRDFQGAKILLKQDENHRFLEIARWIGDTGIDTVFTCLPPEAVPLVYPSELVGQVHFSRMLTGYVTPTLRQRDPLAGAKPIDVGYRGSIQPLSFGWLAYEKRKIGTDVASLLQGRGLRLDISSNWEDRIGGDAWFEFLASCKSTLGAESGASIFDLDGTLELRLEALRAATASIGDEIERDEAILRGLADLEGNVHYNQISPRHFEAAACGAVQLLFPGTYSNLLIPGRHFIQLERDYSNLDEAIALVMDDGRRKEFVRRAFEEVVLNPANWIESFVQQVDDSIVQALRRRGLERVADRTFGAEGSHVLLIAAHDPVVDPRLAWIEEGAPEGMSVHQLGVLFPGRKTPRKDVTKRGNMIEAQERERWQPETADWLLSRVGSDPAGMAGAQELLFLQSALRLPDAEFCELFGAPPPSHRLDFFRAYLQYLLDTAQSLVYRAVHLRGVHALIATDLDTLPAALVLKAMLRVPVLYDAHEYWPESDVEACEAEKQFWVGLERRMVAHVDACQTVSPGLAKLMSDQYGVQFATVPNCEPLDRLLPRDPRAWNGEQCVFLFQGNFAPGRGIELMIQAWPQTDPRAILQLRGMDGAYKAKMVELATATGLLGTRIQFPAPVAETDLVAAAAKADVGVIPYTPAGTGYRYCCPNKTSQYMAAGLPILANETEFVSALVKAAGCGVVRDFSRRLDLVQAVNLMCDSRETLAAMGERGREFFSGGFNWNAVTRQMYSKLQGMTAGRSAARLDLYAIPAVPTRLFRKRVVETPVVPDFPKEGPLTPAIVAAIEMPPEPPSRWSRLRQAAVLVWSCTPAPVRTVVRPIVNRVLRPLARSSRRAYAAVYQSKKTSQD